MNVKQNLKIKDELKILSISVLIVIIILKIAFYKENLVNVIKFGLTLCYFSLIPGYLVLININIKLSQLLQLTLSFPLGLAIYLILGYYLNIFLHLKYVVFLPLIMILANVGYMYYFHTYKKKESNE